MLRKKASKVEIQEVVNVKAPRIQRKSKSLSLVLIFGVLIFSFLYIVIPLSIYFCPSVRRHTVFLNYVSLSYRRNLSMPIESGLKCTRNFYISSSDNVELGVWHVSPKSKCNNNNNALINQELKFDDDQPIFLYLHGNAGSRGGAHRVELYKLLSATVDAHIIAFDYRGFGDSTNVSPTEQGLVQDTVHVYKWLTQQVPSSRIIIWGHSLGTGVAVAFMHEISKSLPKPSAVILEAPFTKIIDAASHHPLSILHRYMPFFDTLIAKPIGDRETGFDSLSRIKYVVTPLLILHAEDDGFVPYAHGKKLYEEALLTRKQLNPLATQFVGFEEKLNHGHKYICSNQDLPKIILKFLENISSLSK